MLPRVGEQPTCRFVSGPERLPLADLGQVLQGQWGQVHIMDLTPLCSIAYQHD